MLRVNKLFSILHLVVIYFILFYFFLDLSLENAKDCNQETLFGQHLMVCALQELANLILSLGTTSSCLFTDQANSMFYKYFIFVFNELCNLKSDVLFPLF